jgi:isopentenyldiphosphate isomerase/intracellular septation protein A
VNFKTLLLKFLPGILPIFIFIVADELWGTKVGLMVAIAFGLIEALFVWFKEQRFDKFILFDTLLLVVLGGVSLLLDNEVFFKLKPAILGVLFCILIGVSVFTPNNFILSMSARYMKDVAFNEDQLRQFARSLKILFYIVVFHTLLVFYSVWFLPKEAWAFISGALLYILLGGWVLFEFIHKKMKAKMLQHEEWLPLVDEQGKIIGKALRSQCHSGNKLLHPVVHLHVFNSQGELFLQKRPMNKQVQPGKWDTAVGGHVVLGETIEVSLLREAQEELGIDGFKADLILKYQWNSEIESELVFCFITQYNGAFNLSTTELDGGKFWKLTEIQQSLQKGIFTPNFEHEFHLLSKMNKKKA